MGGTREEITPTHKDRSFGFTLFLRQWVNCLEFVSRPGNSAPAATMYNDPSVNEALEVVAWWWPSLEKTGAAVTP